MDGYQDGMSNLPVRLARLVINNGEGRQLWSDPETLLFR
jgi:hypothetical protein